MRRHCRARLLVTVAAVAAFALFSGCTNQELDGPAAGETRTVTDARGDRVEVPASPARVLTLSEPTLDAVVALGVEPVGTAAARGQSDAVPAYLADRLDGVPVVGPLGSPDLEQVLELEPDLILLDGTAVNDPALLARLRDIAPTLWVGEAGNARWQEAFIRVGEALDRTDEVEQVLGDYDGRVARLSEGMTDPGATTVSLVRWGLASGGYLPVDTFPGAVVDDVGLARPASQQVSGNGRSQPVSLENVADLDADWLFFCTLGGAADPGTATDGGGAVGEKASAEALATAVDLGVGLESLTAYTSGHVVPVDGSVWGSAGGPLAALALVDDLSTALTT